jgi:chromate transporter
MSRLSDLASVFSQLSLLAFGGGSSILAEMQRQVVDVHAWMSAQQFAALYALAQAAPGPNMLVVTLIGWQVAGLPGALVATAALCSPSSVLTFFTARLWYRFRDAPWQRIVQAALMPVTAGLTMGAAGLLARTTSAAWDTAALTGVALALFMFTRLHPLIVLAAAAALGTAGLVQ